MTFEGINFLGFFHHIEPPFQPAEPSVKQGRGSVVNISWKPPYNGNAQITHYLMHLYDSFGVNQTTPFTRGTARLLVLVYNKEYSVSVQAVNSIGVSNMSKSVSFTVSGIEPTSGGSGESFGCRNKYFFLL